MDAADAALVLAAPLAGALVPVLSPHERLIRAFLAGRSARTLAAYGRDLDDFTAWCKSASPRDALRQFLDAGLGAANEAALGYRAALLARGLAPATVNRRLAALRSVVKVARTLGMIGWALEVPGVHSEAYRDTRGPGREGVRRLLAAIEGPAAVRNRALMRLLYDLALRRAEVVGLDLADVDLTAGVVLVLGKGRREKERLTLPAATREALAAWLAVRESGPGPLFVALDRAHRGRRLSGSGLYHMVRQLGDVVGVRARPHGLRHAAITTALDLTAGDVRAVQRFSRHKSVATLMKYDDNRTDLGGAVADRVAGDSAA